MTTRARRPSRRGDNIPTIKDYAGWNEEAEAVWYAENRYDMEHADEEYVEDWLSDEALDDEE